MNPTNVFAYEEGVRTLILLANDFALYLLKVKPEWEVLVLNRFTYALLAEPDKELFARFYEIRDEYKKANPDEMRDYEIETAISSDNTVLFLKDDSTTFDTFSEGGDKAVIGIRFTFSPFAYANLC